MNKFSLQYLFERSFQEPNSGCWIWVGGLTSVGYGSLGVPPYTAHAAAFIANGGDTEEGFEIHHTCGVRCCCNPNHLQSMSIADHRFLNRLKSCAKGHKLSGNNLNEYWDIKSLRWRRICRLCANSRSAIQVEKQRQMRLSKET